MPNVGPLELAIVLIIALIIFGPRKLPELGRSMGKGIREFKGSLSGDDDDDDASRAELEQQAPEADEEESVEGEVVGQRRS